MAKKDDAKKKPGLIKKIKPGGEAGARKALLEELFNDFYSSRRKVYSFNFVRGLFFGFGTALGGSLLIAILLWILNQLGAVVPFLSDFIRDIIDSINVSA